MTQDHGDLVTQRGFTLIETLVSLGLLAISFTLLMGPLLSAARQIRESDRATRASLHAQTLIAQHEVAEPISAEASEGDLEGGVYRWRMQTQLYADPTKQWSMRPNPSRNRLIQIDLDISWGSDPGQRVHWQTLRLVPPARNDGQAGP